MDKITNIHQNSDFDFEYPLAEGWQDTPFKIDLYTIDYEDNRYEATYDGHTFTNCTLTDHNSVIIHVDNFRLYAGCLRVRVEYYIDSASFNDGIYNGVHAEKTNIYMTRAASDVTSVTYEGSPLPNLDTTNIANNVEQALNEIKDKADELDEVLETLNETQEEADELIDDLTEWKETLGEMATKEELEDYVKREELGPYMTEDEVTDYLDDYYTKNQSNTRYYTKTQIDGLLNDINPEVDLSDYITKAQLSSQSYLTRHQDLSDYATKSDLAYVATGGSINLEDYITKDELSDMGYLTHHQSLSGLATQNWVHAQNYVTLDYIDENSDFYVDLDGYAKYEDLNLDQYVTKEDLSYAGYLTSHQSLSDYVTKAYIESKNYLTQHQDLSYYATLSYIENKNFLTQHQDLSDYITNANLNNRLSSYATTQYVENRLEEFEIPDLNNYATKSYVESKIPEQLWREGGPGLKSIMSINAYQGSGYASISEGYNTYTLGNFSHAEGHKSKTYGNSSHAEGANTIAIGGWSHAEGGYTKTQGLSSHTEGFHTEANNIAEHAEGNYNISHTGEGVYENWFDSGSYTVSSIGIGTSDEDRKNAFEVMQNGDIYMYGVGNYDGINLYGASTIKDTIDSINDRIDSITVDNVDLSSYVSKSELSLMGYITSIPANYITQEQLSANGYLTSHQSLTGLATEQYVDNAILNAELGGGTSIDLSNYVTKSVLSSCGYITSADVSQMGFLTEHQSLANYPTYTYTESRYLTRHQNLDNYATKTYVMNAIAAAEIGGSDNPVDLSNYALKSEIPSLEGYVTKTQLSSCGYLTQHQSLNDYATKTYVMEKIAGITPGSGSVDLSNYVTKTQLSNCGYLTSHQSLNGYATETYVMNKINGIEPVTYQVSYTGNITQNISIWQGTQAQYNALPNYTTYQLYLIAQE